jgi:hypothetical protein
VDKLAEADPVSRDALDELLHPWDDVAIDVRGAQYRLPGHAFAGCSRRRPDHRRRRQQPEPGTCSPTDSGRA